MFNAFDERLSNFYKVLSVLCTLIGILGVIGNLLIIIITIIFKSLHKSRFAFVIALSFIDFILAIIVTIFGFVRLILGNNVQNPLIFYIYYRTSFACITIHFVPLVLLNLSYWLLVCVTFERYFSLRYPFKHKYYFKKWVVFGILLIVVVFCTFLAILLISRKRLSKRPVGSKRYLCDGR